MPVRILADLAPALPRNTPGATAAPRWSPPVQEGVIPQRLAWPGRAPLKRLPKVHSRAIPAFANGRAELFTKAFEPASMSHTFRRGAFFDPGAG
jgi:hypothetical protein